MATFPRGQLRFTKSGGAASPERLEFRCDDLSVGRHDSDLCLAGRAVSRRHCVFSVGGSGRLFVHDCGSTNGTYLNGVRLLVDRPMLVRAGDAVQIGDWQLRLEAEPEPVGHAMARSARLEAARDAAAT